MSNQYPPYGGSQSGDNGPAENGGEWPAYPAPTPPGFRPAGGTVAPIVVALAIVGVLVFCGGLFAVMSIGAGDDDVASDRLGMPDLVEVEEGEGFPLAGFEIDDGWAVGPVPDKPQRLTVLDLQAKNTGDAEADVAFDITFRAAGKEFARLMCLGDIAAPGETVPVVCDDAGPRISEWDSIEVIGHLA